MTGYMIYLRNRPLRWGVDDATADYVGYIPTYQVYASKADAKRVLESVPALFDLDDESTKKLSIRKVSVSSKPA